MTTENAVTSPTGVTMEMREKLVRQFPAHALRTWDRDSVALAAHDFSAALAAFQSALDETTAAGAQLVAISPQTPDASLTHAERDGLGFPVLSDLGNRVAREYGLVFTQAETSTAVGREVGLELSEFNGDDSHELPAASTFVISRDGTVRFSSVAGDDRWRVGPEEVLAVLTKEIA